MKLSAILRNFSGGRITEANLQNISAICQNFGAGGSLVRTDASNLSDVASIPPKLGRRAYIYNHSTSDLQSLYSHLYAAGFVLVDSRVKLDVELASKK